jgi:hypothetical protein
LEEEAGEPTESVKMPAFISRSVRQALYDLGYPPEIVDAMSPALAQRILSSERRYEGPQAERDE